MIKIFTIHRSDHELLQMRDRGRKRDRQRYTNSSDRWTGKRIGILAHGHIQKRIHRQNERLKVTLTDRQPKRLIVTEKERQKLLAASYLPRPSVFLLSAFPTKIYTFSFFL